MEPTHRAWAVALLMHSIFTTGPESDVETSICNARCSRARDRIMHGPEADLVGPLAKLSPDNVRETRVEALRLLRAQCRLCGKCAALGLNPP